MSIEWSSAPFHQVLFRELERIDGTPGEISQEGADFAMEVEIGGRPGRFRAFGPNIAAGGGAALLAAPTFIRLDLGPSLQSPTNWSLWTESRSGVVHGQRWSGDLLVQAVEGTGCLSIAVHRYVSEVPSFDMVDLIFQVLCDLDATVGADEGGDRGRLELSRQLTGFTGREKRDPNLKLLARSALGLSFGSLAAGVVLSLLGMPEVGFLVAAGGSTSALPYFLASSSRRKDPGRALDDTLMDTIRTSKMFDTVGVVGESPVLTVPAITESEAGRQGIAGALKSSVIEATSKKGSLKLLLGRRIVLWPPATLEACRLLPTSWVVCELSGDDNALLMAPDWERQESGEDALYWLFTGDEIARGALGDLLMVFGRRIHGRGDSPYR